MYVQFKLLLLLLVGSEVWSQSVVKVFQNKKLPRQCAPKSVSCVKDQLECEQICFQRDQGCVAGQFIPPNCEVFSQLPNKVTSQLKQDSRAVFFLKKVNVARAVGVTCIASSTESGKFGCNNAFDGVYQPGYHNEWASNHEPDDIWIQITFLAAVKVEKVKIWFRCSPTLQNKIITFESAGATTQRFTRQCNGGDNWLECHGQNGEEFDLPGVITPYIRVTAEQSCGSANHFPGMREMEVWGYYW